MWKATINRKEEVSGQQRVYVDFSNGTKTTTEWCIPQDTNGFKSWVKARITAFETAEEMASMADGQEIDISNEAMPTPTPEEQAATAWLGAWKKLESGQKLKQMNESLGMAMNPEDVTALEELAAFVKTNFKQEYIDLI